MRALIVDDEQNNIENLSFLLKQHCAAVNIIGSARSVDEARQFMLKNDIDLLFLDIQMPEKSGFDLLVETSSHSFQVIFVTAFDSYAIKAIKFSALDYLLKPINTEELIDAVKRAEVNFTNASPEKQIKHLLHQIKEDLHGTGGNIALQLANELRFVKLSDIIYCQSENNYTLFYLTGNEKVMVSKGLYEFESLLPEDNFIRCHQSYIVNRSFVRSLHRDGAVYYLETTHDQSIPVSRSKKEFVRSRLTERRR